MKGDAEYRLTAFVVGDPTGWTIEPATPRRQWMDAHADGFANRCLPLLIANQAGWVVRGPAGFSASWDGRPEIDGVVIRFDDGDERFADHIRSHFGAGIVTFSLPWLFRTSAGFGLVVRGPTNSWKHGAVALDGLVETDWAPFTFTMNWKLTAPGQSVRFDRGEAIALLAPCDLGRLEEFEVETAAIETEPALAEAYHAWGASRTAFIERADRAASEWQKHYFRGTRLDGASAPVHRSRLRLRPFERE